MAGSLRASPSTRVLGNPELLGHIFSASTLHANTVHARVCKAWFELAIEIVWREVPDLTCLLQLLSPLLVVDEVESREGPIKFVCHIKLKCLRNAKSLIILIVYFWR